MPEQEENSSADQTENNETASLREIIEKSKQEQQEKRQDESVELAQYVVFRVKDSWFGFEGGVVQEIIKLKKISPFPLMPDCYIGLVPHRGTVLPVIELAEVFSLTKEPTDAEFNLSKRAIVIDFDKMLFVVSTDYLEGIVLHDPNAMLNEDQIDENFKEFVKKTFVHRDNLIKILDVEKLIAKIKV